MITAGFVVLVLVALGGLLCGVRTLQISRHLSPEGGRKLVHVGMGLIGFPLPWVFPHAAPIWLLAALATVVLSFVRFVPAANRRLGSVLGGTGRLSLGELYFPVGVALAFTVGHESRPAYCAALGVLAFADTAGALIGSRWGQRRYAIVGDPKSIEGSAAVLGTATLWIALVLAALGDAAWPDALIGGAAIGGAAMVIEAVSWRGLDNLLLPVAVVELVRGWNDRLPDHASMRATGLLCTFAAAALFAVIAWFRARRRETSPPGPAK